MRFEHIFFDLDGTLTDPALGITNAIIYARKKWGLDPGKNEDYYKFIGPPMPKSFETYWGMSREDAAQTLAYYREYYTDVGLFENAPYPGMAETLQRLSDAGAKLYVATSKPTFMSVRILEKFDLAKYFVTISGSDPAQPDSTKADVIRAARDQFGVDMAKAVMVGDRSYDVAGAHECAIPCVGVLYGYGGRDELTAAGADYIAESVADLGRILLA